MRILYERCCGLDIHKVSIAVCVVITKDGKTEEETRRFGTMTADLLELAAWLKVRGIEHCGDRLRFTLHLRRTVRHVLNRRDPFR